MINNDLKINRNYGYDILINNFEPFFREYILNELFILNYKINWKDYIPKGVFNEISQIKKEQLTDDCTIYDFFEEISFLNLKDIVIAFNNFKHCKSFIGNISKEKFIDLMDNLNSYRRKIAHAKSTFGNYDLLTLIEHVKLLCQGDSAKEIGIYLENEGYKNAKDIPFDFFEEYECQNNLPSEDYDHDGGFVGREKEKRDIIKYIKSEQDRIITITGSGGVGKTAIVLKVAYSFLTDSQNHFNAIIWFSAKINKLTDDGIVPLLPGIKSDRQLIEDILEIVDPETLISFKNAKVPFDSFKNHLYNIFSSQKSLLIIDNLETIIENDSLISFIKDIPRPSQVLITSRKGLGEIERRYPISDMLEKDAIQLFRIIAKERKMFDLLSLQNETISELIKKVKCYPLLIKWSIGQIFLGKDIEAAFCQIFDGESEIAKFSFNDVFSLLSDDAKIILFSIIVQGDKLVSRYVLMHLTNLTDDQFEDAIKELVMTSFITPESKETETGVITEYSTLEITRGFIDNKLNEDNKSKEILLTRYYHLSEQLQDFEKSKSSYSQSLFSLGIKTQEDQVAFNYVKAAKNFYYHNDINKAEENFEKAIEIAPKFPYALGEFSKFEFKRGDIKKALRLAKDAINLNPDNYHAWFNYGISLRKNREYHKAVDALKKAKELNPKHLPIYNELGRGYTFIGEYEKAMDEFNSALKEEKYPNYRHKIMTIQYLADNYFRWSESFSMRRDSEGQIEKLQQALETVNMALEIDSKDKILWKLNRKICLQMGIALSNNKGFEEGKPYLKKCLQTIKIGKVKILPDKNHVSEACFYLAFFCNNENDKDIKQIEKWINVGLGSCKEGSKNFEKLNDIRKKFCSTNLECLSTDRKYGFIRYYNLPRKFGIIEIEKETYLFFLSGFRERISTESLYYLDSRIVSCILIEDKEKKDNLFPVDIVFEDEKYELGTIQENIHLLAEKI